MNYNDIVRARQQAEREIELADTAVQQAARLITGRLKTAGVTSWILYDLKRELKNYNMQTGNWRV